MRGGADFSDLHSSIYIINISTIKNDGLKFDIKTKEGKNITSKNLYTGTLHTMNGEIDGLFDGKKHITSIKELLDILLPTVPLPLYFSINYNTHDALNITGTNVTLELPFNKTLSLNIDTSEYEFSKRNTAGYCTFDKYGFRND